jgi:hypothetical protein
VSCFFLSPFTAETVHRPGQEGVLRRGAAGHIGGDYGGQEGTRLKIVPDAGAI